MSIKLDNITKKYDNKLVLDAFSYEFLNTGLYALVGESGAGKTTLLRIIAGLDQEFSGKISGCSKKDVSMMFQEHRLFKGLSAIDNILVSSFHKATATDVNTTKDFLRRLRLDEKDFKLCPDELSGGMKQRISFARAVLKNSKVLLLDEPLKELDSELANEFINIIIEQAKTRLVIIVTHRLEFLGENLFEIIKIPKQNA